MSQMAIAMPVLYGLAQGWRIDRDNELIKLLRQNGFKKENCRDKCWVKNKYCFRE